MGHTIQIGGEDFKPRAFKWHASRNAMTNWNPLRMATVCPSPHSPLLVRGGRLHAFDKHALLADMKNVVFAALGRGRY